VNEQLGTVSQGTEGAAQVEWLLTEAPAGAFTLLFADGTSIELH
jgi:hypothetical protein